MISSSNAMEAIGAAEQKATELGVSVTICVVDEHGVQIATKRMDGALTISPKFAQAKAYTSATLRAATSSLSVYATEGKPYFGLTSLFDGKLTVIAGGIPVMEGESVIGAVGVGGSADVSQDEACAQAAVRVLEA
jgi:uncharacterized protein GlcG (DUF336 family)